jgi:hypothetical protein
VTRKWTDIRVIDGYKYGFNPAPLVYFMGDHGIFVGNPRFMSWIKLFQKSALFVSENPLFTLW